MAIGLPVVLVLKSNGNWGCVATSKLLWIKYWTTHPFLDDHLTSFSGGNKFTNLAELSDGSHCKRQQEESMDPYLFLHNLDDTTSDSQIISSNIFKNTQRETNHW